MAMPQPLSGTLRRAAGAIVASTSLLIGGSFGPQSMAKELEPISGRVFRDPFAGLSLPPLGDSCRTGNVLIGDGERGSVTNTLRREVLRSSEIHVEVQHFSLEDLGLSTADRHPGVVFVRYNSRRPIETDPILFRESGGRERELTPLPQVRVEILRSAQRMVDALQHPVYPMVQEA